jgi:hypothetical protein
MRLFVLHTGAQFLHLMGLVMIWANYSPSSDEDLLFGTHYKRHNFFAIFQKAAGQKHQQAMA